MKRAPATKKARVDIKVAVKSAPDTVQLRLLPGGTTEPDWMLDDRTRKVGLQGVAHAREILRRVAPPQAVRRAS
jgi:hypothetical protein